MKKFKCKEGITCQSSTTALDGECGNEAKYLVIFGAGSFFMCEKCAKAFSIPGVLRIPLEEMKKEWFVI